MAQAPAKPELMLETVTASEETLIRCIGKMTYTSAEALRSVVRPLFPETKRVVLDLELVTKPLQDPHATPEAQRALVNFQFADSFPVRVLASQPRCPRRNFR